VKGAGQGRLSGWRTVESGDFAGLPQAVVLSQLASLRASNRFGILAPWAPLASLSVFLPRVLFGAY